MFQHRLPWAVALVALAPCLTGTAPARADEAAERVGRVVREQMAKSHTPGVSVAVIRNGQLALAQGYGLASVELSVPATADTVYEVLSVAKQFTAAAVMLLVEEGRVGLDEPVAKYLPDSPAAWQAVTVRHLLSHTSGIPDYTDVRGFFENIRLDATPDELLKPVKEKPLSFAPESRWRYSNANYYLLGQIVERVSGAKLADFLRQRVFGPLGMAATRMNDPTDIIPHRAAGYHWLGDDADKMPPFVTGYHGVKNVLQNAVYVSPTRKWAAGAVVSTATDLAKWDAALNTSQLLKKSTVEQMMAPAKLAGGADAPYGFGNELSTAHGVKLAGHQGGGVAFNATYLRCVDGTLSVVVLCNQTSAPSRPLAQRIAAVYRPDLSYEGAKALADPDPKVTERLRGLLRGAQKGEADEALFAPEARQTVAFVKRVGPRFLGPKRAQIARIARADG
jgi:CubicO group peptidase (beta-lactamase class C family)